MTQITATANWWESFFHGIVLDVPCDNGRLAF